MNDLTPDFEKVDWPTAFMLIIAGIIVWQFLEKMDRDFEIEAMNSRIDTGTANGRRRLDECDRRLAKVELKTDGMVIRAVPAPGSQPFSIVPTVPPSSDPTS